MKKSFEFNINKDYIPQVNWKVFWMTFVAIFIMVMLQHLGIRLPKIFPTEPVNAKTVDVISSKLEENNYSYKINNSNGLLPKAYASADYENANSYVVIDFESGDVIAEKNISQKTYIASLTKIMTAVVALDLASQEELFTISHNASLEIPTKIGVIPNEKMSVNELLHALLLTSANDAAEVIKEGIDLKYKKEVFIDAMNKKAEILHLTNSHFQNAQGFDKISHYSTAEDLAILSHYALTKYPLIQEIVKKDYKYIKENDNHKQFDLYNWNGLIGVYPDTIGVKIGSTGRADKTTIVLSERDNKKILVIVLGAPSIIDRDLWAAQLLDLGYKTRYKLEPVNITHENLQLKYDTWNYWN